MNSLQQKGFVLKKMSVIFFIKKEANEKDTSFREKTPNNQGIKTSKSRVVSSGARLIA